MGNFNSSGNSCGLRNDGTNTCYANAVLQCLLWCPTFVVALLTTPCQTTLTVLHQLQRLARLLWAIGTAPSSAVCCTNPLRRVIGLPCFLDKSQQDAGHFLTTLVNRLHDDQVAVGGAETREGLFPRSFLSVSDLLAQRRRSPILDQFQIALELETECCTCHRKSTNFAEDTMFRLSVPQKDGANSWCKLGDCIAMNYERLDGDNKYECSQCKSLQPAMRRMRLRPELRPPILVLRLGKSEHQDGLLKQVNYPATLKFPDCHYQLQSVAKHRHSHYTAAMAWLRRGVSVANDSRVYSIAQDQLGCERDASLLFYVKGKNQQCTAVHDLCARHQATIAETARREESARKAAEEEAKKKREEQEAKAAEAKAAAQQKAMEQAAKSAAVKTAPGTGKKRGGRQRTAPPTKRELERAAQAKRKRNKETAKASRDPILSPPSPLLTSQSHLIF